MNRKANTTPPDQPSRPGLHGYLQNGLSLKIDPERCTGCGQCLEVCPHRVLGLDQPGRTVQVLRRDWCMECGACRMNCPFGAIQVDSGVGCVAAIVNGFLRGTAPSCDCSGKGDSPGGKCC